MPAAEEIYRAHLFKAIYIFNTLTPDTIRSEHHQKKQIRNSLIETPVWEGM